MRGNSIRPHLMLTLSALLLLTMLMAGFSLFTLWKNQFLLDEVTESTLADTQIALNLSEGVAQIAAMAPYTASSARPFQVQNEKVQLTARSEALKRDAAKLTKPEYANELGKRVNEVETALNTLMSNVEQELYIREDLMAQQFNLDDLRHYPFADGFTSAFVADPTRIPEGWLTQLQRHVEGASLQNPTLRNNVMPVLANLARSSRQIEVLRAENAYLLAAIRAQSGRMADYVRTIVLDHQQKISLQQAQAKDAINQVTLLMGIILVSLCVGVFYIYRFNDAMARDLQLVTNEMLALASGNTGHEPVTLSRPDEIGQLADAFIAFQQNAIEKTKATEDLYQQKVLLETLFNEMQDGLSAFDNNNRLLAWNRQYAQLLGIDDAELHVGMTLRDIHSKIAPSLMQYSLAEQNDENTLQRQRSPQVFERQFKDGRIIEYRSQPIPSGGFITLYRDLTEKRQIDLKLRQAQKMETLGQLTGGIAHDFNNLLSALSGNLELLDMSARLDDANRIYLNRALSVTEKGSQLIERLLAFSRREPLHPERVELEQTLIELSDLLEYTLDNQSRLVLQLAEQESSVFVDKSGLENSLINLLLNANAAMTPSGTVTVSTRLCCYPESRLSAVALEVEDTGSGIDPVLIANVMEPFFTTKDKGQGNGLGLSMVYGFVEQSGGTVTIDSTLGVGTRVTLILPVSYSPAEKVPDDVLPLQDVDWSQRHILLVDDDTDVALPIKTLLEHEGAQITLVNAAKDALSYLALHPVDLVLSDINLGGSETGIWLKSALSQNQPELPVLLMSGLPRTQLAEQFGYPQSWPLITKPITRKTLISALTHQISAC